jgi:PhnB protein
MLNEDGSVGHVEVEIGNSVVILFDSRESWPETPHFFVCILRTQTRHISER